MGLLDKREMNEDDMSKLIASVRVHMSPVMFAQILELCEADKRDKSEWVRLHMAPIVDEAYAKLQAKASCRLVPQRAVKDSM